MIEEAYVSFEVAKLLKEKGFDEKCRASYDKDGNFLFHKNCYFQLECGDGYLVPTHQMACKWLREVHKLFIEIKMSKNTFLWGYRVSISNGNTSCLHANNFNKYEEAVEAALKYTLENLI